MGRRLSEQRCSVDPKMLEVNPIFDEVQRLKDTEISGGVFPRLTIFSMMTNSNPIQRQNFAGYGLSQHRGNLTDMVHLGVHKREILESFKVVCQKKFCLLSVLNL